MDVAACTREVIGVLGARPSKDRGTLPPVLAVPIPAWGVIAPPLPFPTALPLPFPTTPRRSIAAVAAPAQHGPFETETSSSPPLPSSPSCVGVRRHHRTPGCTSPANETARSPGAVQVRRRRVGVLRRPSSSSSLSVNVGQSAYVDGGVVSGRVRWREGGYSL